MTLVRDYAGQVKRIDALLRARFPYLDTEIYETRPNRFVIVVPPDIEQVERISTEFDRSIRFVTVPVSLSNTRPDAHLRHVPGLTDQASTGTMTGLPLTRNDLVNLLLSKFPDLDVVDVEEDDNSPIMEVTVVLGTDPNADVCEAMDAFIAALSVPVPVRVRVAAAKQPVGVRKDVQDPLFVWASALRPLAPSYVREDERFWFENIESIAANRYDWSAFPGMEDDAFRCYFDFTLGGTDHLNLRHALLLYDQVWCSLPLREQQDAFLARQSLTKEDLLEIVEAGRLKFLTTQPEERLDFLFLDAVHERSRGAILGRRTTAALLVADVARTYDQSFLRDPHVVPILKAASEYLAERLDIDPAGFLQIMLWPLASLRGGLAKVLDIGSKGGPYLPLANAVANLGSAETDFHLEVEALLAGEPVHLAHALDATLLGPLSEPRPRHLMKAFLGHLLNFHRAFNADLGPAWLDNERRRDNAMTILPPVPLFEFNPAIPIAELLWDTGLPSTRQDGRSLYARLAAMSPDERKDEIARLSAALRQRGRKMMGAAVKLDALETLGSFAAESAGMAIGSFLRLGKVGIERLRRRDERVDTAIGRVSKAFDRTGARGELSFLSRVDRVASFKHERV